MPSWQRLIDVADGIVWFVFIVCGTVVLIWLVALPLFGLR